MSLTKKVAFNTTVQIIGKVITTLISLILIAALTRYLGVSGFGQYTTIFAYISFFGVLADFGFFWILVREISQPDSDINRATSNILTLRTIVGFVVFALGALIALFIPQYHDFRYGIAIIALASLFLTLNSTYIGIFQNKHRMDKAVITDIIGRALILGLTLILIKQNYNLNMILWAYAFGNMINFFASSYLGRIYVQFRPTIDIVYWRKLFVQAVPMATVLILGLLYFKIDSVMLSLMKTSEDVGIYGPSYKVLEILLTFPSLFMGNVFPVMTRYIYKKDERLPGVIQKSFDFIFMLSIPVIIGVILTAPKIISLIAGDQFLSASTIPPIWGIPATATLVLQILIFAVGFSFISSIFGFLIIAAGKQSKMIKPYLLFVVVNVGLNLILIPKISYIGAALVTVITEILALIFTWYIAHHYVNMRLRLSIIWKSILAGLVMAMAILSLGTNINIFIVVIIAAIIYGTVLYLLGGYSKDTIMSVFKKDAE